MEPDAMEHFHKTLLVAMKNDAFLMVMDTLVKMAEVMIERGEKERAAEILTISLQYPLRDSTRARAITLYDDLEAELCPRVMLDARRLADEITLDDLLAVILGKDSA